MKPFFETTTPIKFIAPDYDGIAAVLQKFVELYKVCSNHAMLDKMLIQFMSAQNIIELKSK